MTYFELQTETAKLGFLPCIADQTAFLASANRALLQVSQLRPRQKTVRLLHLVEENILGAHTGVFVTAEPISIVGKGARAYAFYGIGSGMLRIYATDSAGETLIGERQLTGESFYQGGIYRDAAPIPSDMGVRLEFVPTDLLQIETPALYAVPMAPCKGRKTTSTEWFDYDLSEICTDFLSCEGLPAICGSRYQRKGQTGGGHSFVQMGAEPNVASLGVSMPSSHTVRIPTATPGIYTVTYFATPTMFTGEAEQEADVASDLAPLLPLLCAAELFYEEDPEKSAFYLELYQAQARLRIRDTALREIPVYNITDW